MLTRLCPYHSFNVHDWTDLILLDNFCIISRFLCPVTKSGGGGGGGGGVYYVIPSELLSVCPSVCPSVRPSAVDHSCLLHNFDTV